MPSTGKTKQSSRFAEKLLNAAGGAILAGSLGIELFAIFQKTIPNELLAVISGIAGGLIAIAQRKAHKRSSRGDGND